MTRGDRRSVPLNFIEDNDMKPHQPTCLVELAGLLIAGILTTATPSFAHAQAATEPITTRFEILDNSFLVEEAFNQEGGVFQNIFGWTRTNNGNWAGTFTQEWPVFGMTHQFSVHGAVCGR